MTPVVALHGFTGTGASWQPVQTRLRGRGPFWCPDLLGHGAVEDAPATRFDDEVDRLAAAAARRFPQPIVLVGYSLGARVALRFVLRHATQVARVMLIGVRAGLRDPVARNERVRADERWARLLENEGVARFVDRWQALPLFASQARLPDDVQRAQRRRRLRHDAHGLARALRVLGLGRMPDGWPALPSVTTPVRLMTGSLDRSFCDEAEAMAAVLPRARVEVVPDVGHNVMLEAPAAVAAAIDKERERV